MLTNSIRLLKEARKCGNCIPAFNFYNLETAQAIFHAAREVKQPVIAAFGAGYLQNASLQEIVSIIRALADGHPYPVILHLDHCKEENVLRAAIEAGFTSVMYDGSHLPFPENMENTRQIARYAHECGVSVEGELGYMNPEDGTDPEPGMQEHALTDAAQAREFVGKTGVDALAVAVGNAHGLYKGIPSLHLERLRKIYQEVGIPLVLHGCSGLPRKQIREAVSIAVAKINVNTELSLTASKQIALLLEDDRQVRLESLMIAARESMVKAMIPYFVL